MDAWNGVFMVFPVMSVGLLNAILHGKLLNPSVSSNLLEKRLKRFQPNAAIMSPPSIQTQNSLPPQSALIGELRTPSTMY